MEKIELKRSEIITLLNNMQLYVDTVGKKADRLAGTCDYIITYEPNEQFIEDHNKKLAKFKNNLERTVRKLSNNNAKVYTDGDKKGALMLTEKGELMFSVEGQNKLNEETDILNDQYNEDVYNFMKEKVPFYIEKTSIVPESLPQSVKNALDLLIP